jgi:phage/plasmid-associated DNA primase
LASREPITARGLNQDDFEFPPTWKLWLATNHKPVIRGTDKGIWRRIKLIPFTVTLYGPEDKGYEDAPEHLRKNGDLGDALKKELPGILNWAIEGCLAWQRDGLGEPEEVKSATSNYKNEMDVLAAFLSECCVVSPRAHVGYQKLYKVYGEWCAENHETQLRALDFAKRLEERGFEKKRTESNGANGWKGIGLKADYPDHFASAATEDASGTTEDASVNPSCGTKGDKAQSQINSAHEAPVPTEETEALKTTEGILYVQKASQNLYRETPKNASVSFSASVDTAQNLKNSALAGTEEYSVPSVPSVKGNNGYLVHGTLRYSPLFGQ